MRFTKGMEPFGGYAFLSYLKEISNYQNNLKTWDNRYIHVSHVRDQANVSAPCPFAFPLVAHNVRSKIQLPFPSSCSLGSHWIDVVFHQHIFVYIYIQFTNMKPSNIIYKQFLVCLQTFLSCTMTRDHTITKRGTITVISSVLVSHCF